MPKLTLATPSAIAALQCRVRDARPTVEDQRHRNSPVDLLQQRQVKAVPAPRLDVDIADADGQQVNSRGRDELGRGAGSVVEPPCGGVSPVRSRGAARRALPRQRRHGCEPLQRSWRPAPCTGRLAPGPKA